MKDIIQGIQKFQDTEFGKQKKLFQSLKKGQSPKALLITCSDSRIAANLFTQTQPGELFIQRTAGNIVPPHGAVHGGEAATIEYAVSALEVPDIIICGHSQCGAMGGLLALDKLKGLPAVVEYLKYAEATRRIVETKYSNVKSKQKRLMMTVEENVLVQLENLRTHPSVAAALGSGKLRLHGWVYHFETGEVVAFDPAQARFVPLDGDSPGVSPPDRTTQK